MNIKSCRIPVSLVVTGLSILALSCGGEKKAERSARDALRQSQSQGERVVVDRPRVSAKMGGPGFAEWLAETGDTSWMTGSFEPMGDPEAIKGGRIRVRMAEFPATLRNYGKDSNTTFLSAVNSLIYESLLEYHKNTLTMAPKLATHWKISEDKLTFSYRINPEAVWAHGEPVTADDVIATWCLLVDEGILSFYENELYGKFHEPVAESPYIIHVTCKEENWRYFLNFSMTEILPACRIGGMSGSKYLDNYQFKLVPGSGPYEIKPEDIIKDVSITLTKRDDWWGRDDPAYAGMYNFDEIEWVTILDERLHLEKFKKGELDVYIVSRASWWVNEFNYDEIQRGIQLKRKIFNEQVRGISGLALNTRKSPFDDIRVRKALAHLYDRDTLIDKIFHNEYVKLKSYFPGGVYENPDNEYYEYDPEKAVRLLAEAGWKERNRDGWLVNDVGEIFELVLTFATPSWERIHTLLQEELAKVGIKLDLKQLTRATQFKNNMEHNFKITMQTWGGAPWPNPEGAWHSKQADPSNTANITGMKDERVDALIELYNQEYDPAWRVDLIHELDAILMGECHYALAWQGPAIRLVFWNRFGQPDGLISRGGYGQSRYDFMHLWYADPDKEKAMEAAMADPSLTIPAGEVEDRYWLKKLGKE